MIESEILEKLESGELKIYEIENYIGKSEAVEIRRKFIESKTGKYFPSFDHFAFEPEKVFGRNCENLIGGISIALGIAGPIRVKGEHANGEYFIPIATTEGALVASISRGAKVISLSGGASSISQYVGITRAPLFRLANISKAQEFKNWLKDNFEELQKIAGTTDKYLTLKSSESFSNGKNVWARFAFDTGDAMGMNMAVVATKAMCEWIVQKFKDVKVIAISGNMCIDKKPSSINSILGRGRIVETEVTIPAATIEKELKSTVDQMIEVNHAKTWLGSAMAGSLGFNAHVANMIAGIFIATGQDPAHVVDASTATTNMEKDENGNLYAHVRIPSLNIATVGGGTGLASQFESQQLMLSNISKDLIESKNINQTQKMAEIIGAIVLAGELSLHAAFASNSFVNAHQKLGRGKN